MFLKLVRFHPFLMVTLVLVLAADPVEAFSAILPGLKRYSRADIDPGRLSAQLERMEKGSIRLDLGGEFRWDLELERYSIRAPGYAVRLITPQGLQTLPPTPESNFRGAIRGKPGSRVRLSLDRGRLTGSIDPGTGDPVFVEPIGRRLRGFPASAHAVYRQSDLEPRTGPGCGVKALVGLPKSGSSSPVAEAEIVAPGDLSAAPGTGAEPCATLTMALAIEYTMVKWLGSPEAVEKWINDVYVEVDRRYQDPRLNLKVRIGEIHMESGPVATWGNITDIENNLDTFGGWSTTGFKNPFSLGTMWYYRIDNGADGIANISSVCTRGSNVNVMRAYTKTIYDEGLIAAHEMGHNLGCQHVNDPVSVMYASGINKSAIWDVTSVNAILKSKNSRTCFGPCEVKPALPVAGFAVTGESPCADIRKFTDRSQGAPTAWLWSFGDGLTSTLQHPTHQYAQAGTYAVQVKVTNAVGSDTAFQGNLRVKPMSPPLVQAAEACSPATLSLSATGTGVLRWYDRPTGGAKLGEGAAFLTPPLTQTKTYYVEDGEPDRPAVKVGPASNAMGAGKNYISATDRGVFFDVRRPATLASVTVYAGSAGPRTFQVEDSAGSVLVSRTVQVPIGQSKVLLDFVLDPGSDYSLKYAGQADSLNLYRNSEGAVYPYNSPDSLVSITASGASPDDSVSGQGYYYFFYDWEVRERSCSSPRAAVVARIGCITGLAARGIGGSLELRSIGDGTYRVEGMAAEGTALEFLLKRLDGTGVMRKQRRAPAGRYSEDLNLSGLSRNLYILEVRGNGATLARSLVGRPGR